MWTANSLVLWTLVAAASAQIPSLGWCPDYQAMANFDMNRFLGTWHEAERYFTVTELGSRCVTTTYEKMSDGRVFVYNEIKSALTGFKRVIEGQLQHVGRDGEGKLSVKYSSLPLPYDTHYTILDTDYDTFAVMWSCSGIGPVHTQSAWVMTRDRLPPNLVLQRAYGVLDKFKISRAFFIKTGQEDCTVQPQAIEPVDPVDIKPAAEATPAPPGALPAARDAQDAQDARDVPSEEQPEGAEVSQEVKSVGPLPVAELIISNVVLKKIVDEPIAVDVAIPVLELKSFPEPNKVINEPQTSKKSNEIGESREDPVALVEISEVQPERHDEKLVKPAVEFLKSVDGNDSPLVEAGNPSSDAVLQTLSQNIDS